MRDLQELMQGYLVSADFRILESRMGFLVADRLGVGGDRETRLVWVAPPAVRPEDFHTLEQNLLRDFKARITQYPNARCLLLAHTLEGFSRDFRQNAKDLRVKLNVPVNVFDAEFLVEQAPATRTPVALLRDPSNVKRRIPQPFAVLQDGEETESGESLLTHLRRELAEKPSPKLRIIVGPAGVGKTVLFKSLFANVYEDFIRSKRAQILFPRPIPLIPEYLINARGQRVIPLLDGFLKTDVARVITPSTLEWMLVHGFATWMFDGLDELYARDPDFFEYVLDLLTREYACTQILICARESLLTSCESFSRFLEEYGSSTSQSNMIKIYKLKEWQHASKRAFAWLRLKGEMPQEVIADPPEVRGFLHSIEQSHLLKTLSGLPFYCDLLLDRYEEGTLQEFSDEFALIGQSISWMMQREINKNLLSPNNFRPKGLEEWLDAVGAEFLESQGAGVNKQELEEYAQLVLREDLSERELRDTVTTLVQFPLFAPASQAGYLTFAHELVAEYLAARDLVRKAPKSAEAVARSLGTRIDLANSFVLRCMARMLPDQPGAVEGIVEALKTHVLTGRGFANLLQVLMLALPSWDLVKSMGVSLDGRDLRYVQFLERDLRGMSFRNADLSYTVFRKCDLRDARFEGAVLAGTRFENLDAEALTGAGFGNLEQLDYIYAGTQKIEELTRAAAWVQRVTGLKEQVQHACPTALQLQALFRKFVYPDGTGRRDELKISALHSGRHYPRAAAIDDCIDACKRFGFLLPTNRPDRLRRATGDKYNHIVLFVKNWSLFLELRQMLDSLCGVERCLHVPARTRAAVV